MPVASLRAVTLYTKCPDRRLFIFSAVPRSDWLCWTFSFKKTNKKKNLGNLILDIFLTTKFKFKKKEKEMKPQLEMKKNQELTTDSEQFPRRDRREQHQQQCQRRVADDAADSFSSPLTCSSSSSSFASYSLSLSCWTMMILLLIFNAPLPASSSTAIGNWM